MVLYKSYHCKKICVGSTTVKKNKLPGFELMQLKILFKPINV